MKDICIRAIRDNDRVGRGSGSVFDDDYADDERLKQVLDELELDTPQKALRWALMDERGHWLLALFLARNFLDPHNPEPFDPEAFNMYASNLRSDYDRRALISRIPDNWLERARDWCGNVTGGSSN
jgi:hypothetical protein